MDRDNRRLFEHVFENSSFDDPGSSECRTGVRTDPRSREYFTRDILEYLEDNCEAFGLTATESLTDSDLVSKHKSLLQLLNWAVHLGIFRFALVTNTENCAAQWIRHKIYPVAASDSELLFPLDQLKYGIKGYCDEEWLNAPSRLSTSKRIYSCFLVNQPTPTKPTQESTVMTTITTKTQEVATKQVAVHTTAVVAATKLEIGRAAILLIKEQLRPHVPVMITVVLDTPIADLAIASSCSILATVVSDDPRAKIVSESMLTVAYGELLQKMRLPELMSGVISKIPAKLFDVIEKSHQEQE